MARTLPTPFQIAECRNRAFTDAFRSGADTLPREITQDRIAAGFNEFDARLARVGYPQKALADRFTRILESRRIPGGKLDANGTEHRTFVMRRGGLRI